MSIDELKRTVNEVVSLREEVKNLSSSSRGYSILDYINRFRSSISFVDYGERDRFTVPYYDASFKLDAMLEDEKKIRSQFSTSKAKLVSCMNKYIKGMEKGFKELEKSQM